MALSLQVKNTVKGDPCDNDIDHDSSSFLRSYINQLNIKRCL